MKYDIYINGSIGIPSQPPSFKMNSPWNFINLEKRVFSLYDRKYLYASGDETNSENLTANQQSRLLRLRDMYLYWLRHPAYSDKPCLQQRLLCQNG